MNYSELDWNVAPNRPYLIFAEYPEGIILRYRNTPIKTSWSDIERIQEIKKKKCGKIHKPNRAEIKRVMRAIIGQPYTHHKLDGLRLFVRLVEDGEIQKGAS